MQGMGRVDEAKEDGEKKKTTTVEPTTAESTITTAAPTEEPTAAPEYNDSAEQLETAIAAAEKGLASCAAKGAAGRRSAAVFHAIRGK